MLQTGIGHMVHNSCFVLPSCTMKFEKFFFCAFVSGKVGNSSSKILTFGRRDE